MPYELVKCPTNTKIEYKCIPIKKASIKSKTKSISKTKSKDEPLRSTPPLITSSTRKRCPNGTRKNKKTGKCEPKTGAIKKTVKSKKIRKIRKTIKLDPTKKKEPKILTIESTTPSANKQLRSKIYDLTTSKKKSYTPEINRLMIDEITKTKRRDLFECPKPIDQVKIKLKSGKYKCVKNTSKSAQKQLIRFLNRPRVADCITAPRQYMSNCWFNTLFMSMFISDKGYKFMKPIRQIMITGTRLNGTKLSSPFHRAVLKFNNAIQASIDCVDPNFLLLLDTNEIIFDIHRTISYDIDSRKWDLLGLVPKVGEAGNPINYYKAIIASLLDDENINKHIYVVNKLTSLKDIQNLKHNPDIIVRNISDYSKYNTKTRKPEIFKLNGHTYKLDSVVLRNNMRKHFSCYITLNGEEYAFDGMTFSRLSKFKWRTLLHKDNNFNFKDIDMRIASEFKFNFKIGYQILFYYRVD